MFLTCDGTLGIVPATMDYNGDARPGGFHAGYQEIEGINLGYLQINGTQMFALAQVLSDLFKDIPRTTISKKMETLKIKSRRCDLQELRTLKAIHSVPTRAVKCSLISKADLEALCTSCKSLGPGRRKRKRKSKRREQLLLPGPGELFHSGSRRPASPGPLPGKALRGGGSERHCKRRRLARGAEADRPTSSAKGRPQRAARKGRAHCRLPPGRQAFSLLGNFPCVPSLVVGEDGDLRPAASLGGKDSWALSKIHPLWSWQLGGNAMPVPPSLKFRGYSLEDF
ncbi:elongin BC and Polycomb repressive complex 2-associated protein [Alligator sinensis]|uniref:Elongin BC and Polycomb repressive complex 2-associated protein n=1 Tax=Alligator sinensis TaxID=38654 RepID=A0A3Q0FI53_ALLSI|nr:elongin BC and Polycomb repressive complex 2-associated protein [Alligator sinensis]